MMSDCKISYYHIINQSSQGNAHKSGRHETWINEYPIIK